VGGRAPWDRYKPFESLNRRANRSLESEALCESTQVADVAQKLRRASMQEQAQTSKQGTPMCLLSILLHRE